MFEKCLSNFFLLQVKVSWVAILMITLVASPKQQLHKHMPHSVHIVWFKDFLYILLKCTQVWKELGLLVKALLAWGIYCGRSLGKTTFLELCMNLGCMTNMWENNEQKCGLDWIANTYLIIFVVFCCYNFPNSPWDNVFVCLSIEKEKEFKIQGQWQITKLS